jgi:N,N'-diacetyllegionaminate synthase
MKLIAETAWHHEGDIDFLVDLAEKIKLSKADIAKFHLLLDLDEYIDKSHKLYEGYNKWKISKENWEKVLNIFKPEELMLLCNDTKAIEFACTFNPKIIELHAVCMTDLNLLDYLKANKPKNTKIALGISGNTIEEIDFALNYLNTNDIILMYGFQNYPTKFEEINFNRLKKIMQFYPNLEFGYADHCGYNEDFNELITLTGASLGVNYIEKHVTSQFGIARLDYEATINFEMLDNLHNKMEIISKSLGSGSLNLSEGEKNYSRVGILKKAPILKQDISKDDILTKELLEYKRIKTDLNYSPFEIINKFGMKFNKNLSKGDLVLVSDLKKE